MKISTVIASALLAAIAAPAIAATGDANLRARYDAKHDKYCVSQEITGQRIPLQDCRSKAEWAAAGATFGTEAVKPKGTKLAQK